MLISIDYVIHDINSCDHLLVPAMAIETLYRCPMCVKIDFRMEKIMVAREQKLQLTYTA